MFKITQRGDWSKTTEYLKRVNRAFYTGVFDRYGQEGVNALASATPIDSGATASSWSYKVTRENGKISIHWTNSNVNDGVNIAVILQYGHGTGTGGYVEGVDYINPALVPIFTEMIESLWKEVTR